MKELFEGLKDIKSQISELYEKWKTMIKLIAEITKEELEKTFNVKVSYNVYYDEALGYYTVITIYTKDNSNEFKHSVYKHLEKILGENYDDFRDYATLLFKPF